MRERDRVREIERKKGGRRTARARDRERRWKQDGTEREGQSKRKEDGLRQPDKCSIPVSSDGEHGSHCARVGGLSPPGLLLRRQLNLSDVDSTESPIFMVSKSIAAI